MATRVYGQTAAPPVTFPATSSWDADDPSFAAQLYTIDPAAAVSSASSGAGNGVANDDTRAFLIAIGPLAAQPISGTLKGQVAARESNAATDARIQAIVRLMSGDGATLRGNLLSIDTAALSSEFFVDTGQLRNIKAPRGGAQTLADLQAQAGDWIVIEGGWRNHGTNTGAVRVFTGAGTGVNGDLPENETLTPTTNYRGWFEFSADLKFYVPRGQGLMYDLGIAVG